MALFLLFIITRTQQKTRMHLIKGIIMGFLIAAPVGPIGLLCINRTLRYGRWSGLVTGLGAATADAAYGLVAAAGITAISSILIGMRFWLGLIGGSFLVYLGVKTFFSPAVTHAARSEHTGLMSDYFSTLLLTITNPMTILSFVAIFAGLGVGNTSGIFAPVMLVAGVFLGSALWWLFLSCSVALVHHAVSPKILTYINYVSGIILIVFGIWALTRAL